MELLRSVLKNLPEFQELTAALEGVAMLLAAVAAVLLGIWATRREEGEGA